MEIRTGSVLEADVQTVTNTVNCVGVMGKGIALEFRRRYPRMFAQYAARCARNDVLPGRPYVWRPGRQLEFFDAGIPPWVLNFPTKRHWTARSRVEDIVDGLRYLRRKYRRWGIKSLAVPPLGCGNGKLTWDEVGPILYYHLNWLKIPVLLYAPNGTPPEQLTSAYLDRPGIFGQRPPGFHPPSPME